MDHVPRELASSSVRGARYIEQLSAYYARERAYLAQRKVLDKKLKKARDDFALEAKKLNGNADAAATRYAENLNEYLTFIGREKGFELAELSRQQELGLIGKLWRSENIWHSEHKGLIATSFVVGGAATVRWVGPTKLLVGIPVGIVLNKVLHTRVGRGLSHLAHSRTKAEEGTKEGNDGLRAGLDFKTLTGTNFLKKDEKGRYVAERELGGKFATISSRIKWEKRIRYASSFGTGFGVAEAAHQSMGALIIDHLGIGDALAQLGLSHWFVNGMSLVEAVGVGPAEAAHGGGGHGGGQPDRGTSIGSQNIHRDWSSQNGNGGRGNWSGDRGGRGGWTGDRGNNGGPWNGDRGSRGNWSGDRGSRGGRGNWNGDRGNGGGWNGDRGNGGWNNSDRGNSGGRGWGNNWGSGGNDSRGGGSTWGNNGGQSGGGHGTFGVNQSHVAEHFTTNSGRQVWCPPQVHEPRMHGGHYYGRAENFRVEWRGHMTDYSGPVQYDEQYDTWRPVREYYPDTSSQVDYGQHQQETTTCPPDKVVETSTVVSIDHISHHLTKLGAHPFGDNSIDKLAEWLRASGKSSAYIEAVTKRIAEFRTLHNGTDWNSGPDAKFAWMAGHDKLMTGGVELKPEHGVSYTGQQMAVTYAETDGTVHRVTIVEPDSCRNYSELKDEIITTKTIQADCVVQKSHSSSSSFSSAEHSNVNIADTARQLDRIPYTGSDGARHLANGHDAVVIFKSLNNGELTFGDVMKNDGYPSNDPEVRAVIDQVRRMAPSFNANEKVVTALQRFGFDN